MRILQYFKQLQVLRSLPKYFVLSGLDEKNKKKYQIVTLKLLSYILVNFTNFQTKSFHVFIE